MNFWDEFFLLMQSMHVICLIMMMIHAWDPELYPFGGRPVRWMAALTAMHLVLDKLHPNFRARFRAAASDGYASDDTDAETTYGDSEWSEYDTEDADVDSE
jgi:hypothetical protein